MLISENWLREWVNPDISTRQLAEQLTMAGLEVAGVAKQTAQFNKVVVGQVLNVEPHPNSKRLKLCSVSYGSSKNVQVVCGADNVVADMKVPLAQVGAKLPNDTAISKTKIRGIESCGMICSAVELGLTDKSEGIMQLDESAVVGKPVSEHLQLDDRQIEIELTPNRGDCLSIAGVAREVSALTATRLKPVKIKKIAAKTDNSVPISVKAWPGCPRYVGRVIEHINPEAVTPDWIKEKLRRSGVRPIGAVVDITNYVMLELGQPMHAFDLDNIDTGIVVRYAKKGEKLTLLDERTLTLKSDDLLICDHAGPVALAGIMGGLGSGISGKTHTVLLESAYFAQHRIIGKARRLGMQTDASYRFERGVDPHLQELAIQRATALLIQICGGRAGEVIEAVNHDYIPVKQTVTLRFAQMDKVIGVTVKPNHAENYLKRLGCKVKRLKTGLKVTPPEFRFDLEKEHDLIEEVARLYGYNKIPENPPAISANNTNPGESKISVSRIRNLMIDRGYSEAITYSFVDPNLQKQFPLVERPINLTNPIAENLSQMRLSLIPGLLNALANNFSRQHRQVQLFELGNVYFYHKKQKVEKFNLGVISTGLRRPEQWGEASLPLDFYDLKSDLEAVCALAGITQNLSYKPESLDGFHPGRCAGIFYEQQKVGFIGQLLPSIMSNLDIDQEVYFFQIDAQILSHSTLPSYKSTSKYPSTRRDLSIIVDRWISATEILNLVTQSAGKDLKELKLFDVYTGKPIDSTKKSVSLGLTFQALERTLTELEMDEVCQCVLQELENKFNAKLRQ